MRKQFGIAVAMLMAFPEQAYAQIWEGLCNEAPPSLHDDLNSAIYGTWAADVSVTDPQAPCRFRGESVWTLYEYDGTSNGIRGERRLAVRRARPSGCQRPVRNSIEVDVVTEQSGEGRCAVRANVISRYQAGGEVRSELTRVGYDALTVTTQAGNSVIYHRRPRIRSSRVEDYPNEFNWRRSCGEVGDPPHYLDVSPGIYRQGTTLSVKPMVQPQGPVGPYRLPNACASAWAVSNPAIASLDHSAGTLAISPDAPAGSKVTVSYRVGERSVSRELTVVAANAVVLTGRRSQQAIEGCPATGEPVRELVFSENGRFSVTFFPFETYSDYWGAYRFDPATGALTLTVDGGNYRPPLLDLEGTARLEGERLVLDGFYFGSRNGLYPHPRPGRGRLAAIASKQTAVSLRSHGRWDIDVRLTLWGQTPVAMSAFHP